MALDVLFLMTRPSDEGWALLGAIGPLAPDGRLEVFSSLAGFEARLRGPKGNRSLVVVWDPTVGDLAALAGLNDRLAGLRILLVLPDDGAETVALAHKLRPAYISYAGDGIAEIMAVLGRLSVSGGDSPKPDRT
ncbi:MAG TPA: hypothetical protein P5119_11020 [Candidatus Aminicenantes bacterium]|nr:hypothetical protein [Candidatus Aminicenantes bacterium]HRY65858.1 hypothetical protein [Candidatus Aminicenantes bacterium]HRZ72816.1 hypothetical protein [Candidatus Aminicenantes bacterium]